MGEVLELRLHGPFGLYGPNGVRLPVTSRKSVALLSLLAMSRSGERQRAWLQAQLWGGRGMEQGRASLRRELANLRQVLRAHGAGDVLHSDHVRVRLDLGRVDVDVRRLERAVSEGRGSSGLDDPELLEGIDIPGEEGFEDWLRAQRALVSDLAERGRRQHWERVASGVVADRPPLPSSPAAPPPPPTRPAVAVLGLTSGSGMDEEALADGIGDEIALELARYSTLFVVRGGRPKSRAVDEVAATCRDLGVRYVLAGSVQRSGSRIRVAVRLVDGAKGEQVWSERFDGRLDDLFALEERIAATVAPIVDASIEQAERRRARSRPVVGEDACHLYWRANALFREFQREPVLEAAGLSEKVLAIEPGNAWAASLAAFCHALSAAFGWADDRAAAVSRALAYYEACLRHGGDDPFVLGYAAGTLLAVGGDLVVADHLIGRALELHPRASSTLFWGGWIDLASDRPTRAAERFELALRLNPRSGVRPHSLTGIGIARLAVGRAAEAATLLLDAVQHLPRHPPTLAAAALALAAIGRMDEARTFFDRLRLVGGAGAVAAVMGSPTFMAGLAGFAESSAASAQAIPHASSDELVSVARVSASRSA